MDNDFDRILTQYMMPAMAELRAQAAEDRKLIEKFKADYPDLAAQMSAGKPITRTITNRHGQVVTYELPDPLA